MARPGSVRSPASPRSPPIRNWARPIRVSPRRLPALRRRRSGTLRRLAAISPSARAAGTIATRILPASRRVARSVRHARAITSTASPSISDPASHRIPPRWPQPLWPMTRRSRRIFASVSPSNQLLGDGSNGSADNALAPGEIIESIELGIPVADERAFYRRAISRSYAEWPLVEVVVRAVIADGAFKLVRIVSGAIAPVPIRLLAAESAAQGAAVNAATIAKAVCAIHARRKAARHDRLQARSAERACAGPAREGFRIERFQVKPVPGPSNKTPGHTLLRGPRWRKAGTAPGASAKPLRYGGLSRHLHFGAHRPINVAHLVPSGDI